MTTTTIVGLLLIGLVAGMASSVVGIGGGVVIVPSLVMFLAMTQKEAQGTSLAMLLPPIGILGVMEYYKKGYVDIRIAGILCIAFITGSYLGGKFAVNLSDSLLKKIFGVFLLLIAIKYLFLDKK
ncbi:MAG: sulfite exporter TauE/SafE family protein [Chitinophagia bacterium]|nr:sulfite exporter TauE/SafE family protein [Chitinophagia bacterium]